MPLLKRILRNLPVLLLSPIILLAVLIALAATDLLRKVWGVSGADPQVCAGPPGPALGAHPVTVVIPNWNGRDLLEKYLPSIIAANPVNKGSGMLRMSRAK